MRESVSRALPWQHVHAPAPPASTPAESGDAAAPSDAPVSISHWFTGGASWEEFYTQSMYPLFYERYPNAEIQPTVLGSWTDLYNKLVTAAAGGAPPEVARQKDFFTPDFAVRGISTAHRRLRRHV